MRNVLVIPPIIIVCLVATVLTEAFPFRSLIQSYQAAMVVDQGPGIVLPGSGDAPRDNDNPSDSVIIADVISRDRSISIFASLTRDVDSVAQRLQDSGLNATVLAPLNSALMRLPRKPWEDAEDYERLGTNAYQGADGENRAHKNLERFVEAHVIPKSPMVTGDKIRALAGNTVWMEEKDGKKFIQPGNVEVQSVADKVSNGEVWILKDVMNYAS